MVLPVYYVTCTNSDHTMSLVNMAKDALWGFVVNL